MAGPRAGLYAVEAFAGFRAMLAGFEPDRPERLSAAAFAGDEPEELLAEEVEAIWAAIAERDDWAPFNHKLARLEQARQGWGLSLT